MGKYLTKLIWEFQKSALINLFLSLFHSEETWEETRKHVLLTLPYQARIVSVHVLVLMVLIGPLYGFDIWFWNYSDSMVYFVFHFNTTYVVESKIVKQSLNMRPLASEEKDFHVPCMLPVVM